MPPKSAAPKHEIDEKRLKPKVFAMVRRLYHAGVADNNGDLHPRGMVFYQTYDNMTGKRYDVTHDRLTVSGEVKQIFVILTNEFIRELADVHISPKTDPMLIGELVKETKSTKISRVMYSIGDRETFDWDAQESRMFRDCDEWIMPFIIGRLNSHKRGQGNWNPFNSRISTVYMNFFKQFAYVCSQIGLYTEKYSLNLNTVSGVLLLLGFDKDTIDDIRAIIPEPRGRGATKDVEELDENAPVNTDLELAEAIDGEEADGEAVDGEAVDGEGEAGEGEAGEGEAADGEEADGEEGEEADGEEADGEEADGEEADGEEADGEEADGEEADGEEADGEEADGEEAEVDEADGEEAEGDEDADE